MQSFAHEMLREIYEQPDALVRTMELYLAGKSLKPEVAALLADWPNPAGEILIAASGSSRHSGLYAEILLEDLCGLAVDVEYASEYSCRGGHGANDLRHPSVLVLSQSGETSVTLLLLSGWPARADEKIHFVLPVTSLAYAFVYIGDNLGMWKDQGLDVEVSTLTGIAATNALLSGNVEVSASSGATLITGRARGQKLQVIASIHPVLTVELILRNDVAAQTGVSADAPLAARVKALRGTTLAVDAINGMPHAYLKYVLHQAGLDPDGDLTISPVAPVGMNAAMQAHRIDGFIMSQPWITMAKLGRTGLAWISPLTNDSPELQPLVYSVLMTREGWCAGHEDACRRFGRGVRAALAFMQDEPEKSLAALAPRFKDMDPTVFRAAFEEQRRAAQRVPVTTDRALRATQEFCATAGLINPEEKRDDFAGYYVNDYVQ